MTLEQDKRIRVGWLAFMILAGLLIVGGLFFLNEAFAINATAINEVETQLQDETAITGSYHVFWIIFLLILLGVFMTCMFRMREDRETVFFALASLILSIMLTLLFTSPLDFDFQESQHTVIVNDNGTGFISATVTHQVKQSIIIPYDQEFRFALMALFTGITLFNGLYAIYIITNYHEGRSLNPNRR